MIVGKELMMIESEKKIVVEIVMKIYYIMDEGKKIVMSEEKGEKIIKDKQKNEYKIEKRSGWSVKKVVENVEILNKIMIE